MIEGEFQLVADCGYLVLIVDLRSVWTHGVKSSPVEVMKTNLGRRCTFASLHDSHAPGLAAGLWNIHNNCGYLLFELCLCGSMTYSPSRHYAQ